MRAAPAAASSARPAQRRYPRYGYRRIAAGRRRPHAPNGAIQVWSYDFVFDRCANGPQLKCLDVIDEWTKEGLAIEIDRAHPLGPRHRSAVAARAGRAAVSEV